MRRTIPGLIACALPCAFWLSTAVYAATGDWDRTFGQNGRLSFEIPGVTFTVHEWVSQPDGRVVIVGHTTNGPSFNTNSEIIVARFNPNGALDSNFDGDGVVRFDFGGSLSGGAVNLERQGDGKLLIAAQGGVNNEARVVRLNVDGSRDAGYGTAGEVAISYPSSTSYLEPELKLTPNGNAVVVGRYYVDSASPPPQAVVATRLTTAGVIDGTFGTGGNALLQGTDNLFLDVAAVNSDGSIIVGGTLGGYNNLVPFVGRIRSTGQPDTSFGAGGIVVMPFLNGQGYVSSVATDSNGKVLVSGVRDDAQGRELSFIARFNPDGTPDASFGSSGRIVVGNGDIAALLVDGDRILASGISSEEGNPALLARYNYDGSPDLTFGSRGISRTDFSTGNVGLSSELWLPRRNADGSYAALVRIYNGSDTSYSLARFLAQGPSAGVLGIRAQYEGTPGGGTSSVFETTPTQRFFVSRTGGTEGVVTVQYRTVSDTAIAGQDFVASTGTVTLNDGESSAYFDIQVIDDDIPEPNFDEQFHVELFGPTGGAGLSKQRASIKIAWDFDWGQRVESYGADGKFIEGGTARVLLYRSGNMSGPLTVNYSLVASTASPGSDFTGAGGAVQWPANEGGAREISVPLLNDANAESSEQFTIAYSDPNGTALVPSPTLINITDDDGITDSSIAFAASQIYVDENAGTATFSVLRFGDVSQSLSVPWSNSICSGQGAAAPPQDYTGSGGTVTWTAGDSAPKSISIPLVDDSLFEGIEGCGISINLSYPPLAVPLNENTAFFFIKDNDGVPGQPVASIGPAASVTEGNTLIVPVTLSGLPAGPLTISVNWQVSKETVSSNDLGAGAGSLAWAPGDNATKNIYIPINQDTRDEIDETFVISLSDPRYGVTIGTSSSRFTIIDDDPTPAGQSAPVVPGVQAVASISVREDQRIATVELRRVGDTTDTLSAFYSTQEGTAGSPGDFVDRGGVVSWNANETAIKRVELQINGDAVSETTETFTLTVAPYSPAGDRTPVSIPVTITDDDTPALPARVGFINATESIAESATSVTIQVGRSGNINVASSVDFATAAGTAGVADFTATTGTLTWAVGDAASKMITITLLPDAVDEPDESFTLTLSNSASGTQLDTATVTVTIQDDDVPAIPNPPTPPPAGGSAGGSGGGGGGAETPLSLLALAAILLWRSRVRRQT